MNSLLEYLVERSVRNGALSAPTGDRTGSSGPALPATEGLLSGPGTVRPRSRYERRVGLDSSDAATFLNEEDELRFPRSAPSDRDTSAGPPEQERHLADREAPQEETPRAPGGTALPRESAQRARPHLHEMTLTSRQRSGRRCIIAKLRQWRSDPQRRSMIAPLHRHRLACLRQWSRPRSVPAVSGRPSQRQLLMSRRLGGRLVRMLVSRLCGRESKPPRK
jgi:hypothetical protein